MGCSATDRASGSDLVGLQTTCPTVNRCGGSAYTRCGVGVVGPFLSVAVKSPSTSSGLLRSLLEWCRQQTNLRSLSCRRLADQLAQRQHVGLDAEDLASSGDALTQKRPRVV